MHPLDHLAQCLNHQHHPVVSIGSGYQHRLIATGVGQGNRDFQSFVAYLRQRPAAGLILGFN